MGQKMFEVNEPNYNNMPYGPWLIFDSPERGMKMSPLSVSIDRQGLYL